MRSMPTKSSAGFTLVELLVVAPIVIFAVAAMVGFMTILAGDALITNRRNEIVHGTQSALDTIEKDVRLATNILSVVENIPVPQGSDDIDASFSSQTDYLMLRQNATSTNPYSDSRELVYYKDQPNPCDNSKRFNRPMTIQVVYYIKNSTLYKRTIVPDYGSSDARAVCDEPWQQNSCTPPYDIGTTRCRTDDDIVATDVSAMVLTYYENAGGSTVSSAEDASSVRVELTRTNQASTGDDISFTGTVRASKINPSEKKLTAPDLPTINTRISGQTSVEFSWSKPNNSTLYDAWYSVNNTLTCGTQALSDSPDDSFTVTASHGDEIRFCLKAKNIAGDSGSTPASETVTIPTWSTEILQNGWYNYGHGYAPFGFTKFSENGEVFLRGLIRNQNTFPANATISLIATLPVGYRPSDRLIFSVTVRYAFGEYNRTGLLSIYPDGNIYLSRDFGASASSPLEEWVSLDNIKFMPAASACPWVALTYDSNWEQFPNNNYPTTSICGDVIGRGHMKGLHRPSSSSPPSFSNGENIAWGYGASIGTNDRLIISGRGWGHFTAFDIAPTTTSTGTKLLYRGLINYGTSYGATTADFHTTNYTGAWHLLNLQNGWQHYGGSWGQAECTVADRPSGLGRIVSIHGLIRNGTASNGTTLARLPSQCPPPDQGTRIFSTVSYGSSEIGHARVDIRTNGDIVLIAWGRSGWLSFGDISYVVD